MTTAHETYEELLEFYALDALEPIEKSRFESHLASGCDRCRSCLGEARELTDVLIQAIAPEPAPARVRTELLDRVHRDLSSSDSRRPRRYQLLALAALLALAVSLSLYSLGLRTDLQTERQMRVGLEGELAELRDRFRAFTGPATRAVSLVGQESSANASATAFLDRENGRFFLYVYNLPPLPLERTYQIWLIVSGQPVSVGTFDVTPDGRARLDAQPLPSFDGAVTVAVTDEPAGGVPQPTGAIILLGS